MYAHQAPVLSVCWSKVRTSRGSTSELFYQIPGLLLQDGNKVLSGGADNAGRMFDITTDAPIKVVKWIETPQGGILATGSWDKTLKVIPAVFRFFPALPRRLP
jgi:mRNA export factor